MAQTGEIQMFMKLRPLLTLTAILGLLHTASFILAAQEDTDASQQRVTESADFSAQETSIMVDGHGASADCTPCHGNRPDEASPDTAKLVAAVPQLCSTCHQEYASFDGWVHGPAATGECLFCHAPHESEYEALLTQPIPKLCHECHTAETLGLIAGHSDESYHRCNTCHDSHTGTNRKLLKASFLGSEAGTSYRDETDYRRRPYAFVDRRRSLAGLNGVRILPALERQDLLNRYGITPEIVKTEVERHLHQRGVRTLSDETQSTEQPGLYVSLRLVELRFPGYSNEVCALSGSLDISLRQTVELVAQPTDAERRICLAGTWDTSAVVVWGLPQIQKGLTDALDLLVDRFCSDYLAANPSAPQETPRL